MSDDDDYEIVLDYVDDLYENEGYCDQDNLRKKDEDGKDIPTLGDYGGFYILIGFIAFIITIILLFLFYGGIVLTILDISGSSKYSEDAIGYALFFGAIVWLIFFIFDLLSV